MTKTQIFKTGLLANSLMITTVAFAGPLDQEPIETRKSVTLNQQVAKNTQPIADSSSEKINTLDSITLLHELYESEEKAAPAVPLNKQAAKFVAAYVEENRETLNDVKKRSASYFSVIESIFRKYGIPEELKYLAVVESKLKTSVVSPAGAVGPWQFMPATARYLGLKISGKNDERRHLYKSTVAAAKYLKSLHEQFGDWLLVLAAYNGGAGTVQKAIKKAGSRNFWVLQHHLPKETKLHVKRFIGAHYFFDASGSETMLTQKEAEAYQKLLAEYNANIRRERQELMKLIYIPTGAEEVPEEINTSTIVETKFNRGK